MGNVTHLTISRRIELRTLKKILEFSLIHGPQKKTNMATNCKMSYSRFIPVLNIMEMLELVEIIESTGNYIVITHSNDTQTLYAHNSSNIVTAGWHVVQGQVIGYIGRTGKTTGCHIHFEVRGAKNPF